MTAPTVSRSSGSHHRHTKSVSSINSSLPLQHSSPHYSKVQAHHNVAHQLQSPPPRATVDMKTPRTPKLDGVPSKKKRRQRKPKDTAKSSPDRATASMSDSAVTPQPPSPGQTTPTKPVVGSPGKAYAGPGFHHSPAPSSLPVPKFFSKSVPARRTPGLQAMMEDSDGSQPSSSPPFDNPLEQLFKADREEKARKNRQGCDGSDSDSAPDRDIFGMDPDSPVRNVFNTPRNRNSVARPGAERSVAEPLFTMDSLNGSLPSSPVQSVSRDKEDVDRRTKSAALRQFLLQQPGVFQAPLSPTNASPSPSPASRTHTMVSPQGSPLPQRYHSRPMNTRGPPPLFRMPHQFQTRSPIDENSSPSRPQFSNIFDSRWDSKPCRTETQDVVIMENSLRQILKLDPRPSMTGGVMI
ncbi:hypothetical protein K440DRAFT_241385 [Wilcoxina mikolae CBS 423.85]|nr:hypothetical protein K440DRAFT_241385 [Wilcoxina mikolae CBS 423.85]